jgi:hypothetical protein
MELAIHKISYLPEHFEVAQPSYVRNLDNTQGDPKFFEYTGFFNFYQSGGHRKSEISGIVSPVFEQKSLVGYQHVHDWISANPGYDVYIINPFPITDTLAHDYWQFAELTHPGIIEFGQHAIEQIGFELDLGRFPRLKISPTSYCNYWFARENFWEDYLPVLNQLINLMTRTEALANSNTLHYQRPMPMWVFFAERFLTTFLVKNLGKYSFLSYGHSEEQVKASAANELDWFIYEVMKPLAEHFERSPLYGKQEHIKDSQSLFRDAFHSAVKSGTRLNKSTEFRFRSSYLGQR